VETVSARGHFVPPTVTGVENVTIVFSFAPARQTSP